MTLARCALERELARLARSSLLHAGGYGIYRGLLDAAWVAAMLDEAMGGERRPDQVASDIDAEEVRGGTPARRLTCVEGGSTQDALFANPALLDFMAAEVRLPVRPCGTRASYSIYDGAHAHLDVHRDVVGCDLALVTCLYDDKPDAAGGAVDVWLDDLTTPLSDIRANIDRGRDRLVLHPGDSLLIHGGLIPHRIPQPGVERLRVVSLMCVEIVA